MKFTTEMLEKAKTAKTAEELLELAKAENVEMTAEEAAKYFAELHKPGELSDEELDNVAGGCGVDPDKVGPDDRADSAENVTFLYGVGRYVDYYGKKCEVERKRAQYWQRGWYPQYLIVFPDGSSSWVYQYEIRPYLL